MSGAWEGAAAVGAPPSVALLVLEAADLVRIRQEKAAIEKLHQAFSGAAEPVLWHPLAQAKLHILQALAIGAQVRRSEALKEQEVLKTLHFAIQSCAGGVSVPGSVQCLRLAAFLFKICLGRPGGEERVRLAAQLLPALRELRTHFRAKCARALQQEEIAGFRWPFEFEAWREGREQQGDLLAYAQESGMAIDEVLSLVHTIDGSRGGGAAERERLVQASQALAAQLALPVHVRLALSPDCEGVIPSEDRERLKTTMQSATGGGNRLRKLQRRAAKLSDRSTSAVATAGGRAEKLKSWLLTRLQAQGEPASRQWSALLRSLDTPAGMLVAEARQLVAAGAISQQEAQRVLSVLQLAQQGHAVWCYMPDSFQPNGSSPGSSSQQEAVARRLREGVPFQEHAQLAGWLEQSLLSKKALLEPARTGKLFPSSSDFFVTNAIEFLKVQQEMAAESKHPGLARSLGPLSAASLPGTSVGSGSGADDFLRQRSGSSRRFAREGLSLARGLAPSRPGCRPEEAAVDDAAGGSSDAANGSSDAASSSAAGEAGASTAGAGACAEDPAPVSGPLAAKVEEAAAAWQSTEPQTLLHYRDGWDDTARPLTVHVFQQHTAQQYLDALTGAGSPSEGGPSAGEREEEAWEGLQSQQQPGLLPGGPAAEHEQLVGSLAREVAIGWTLLLMDSFLEEGKAHRASKQPAAASGGGRGREEGGGRNGASLGQGRQAGVGAGSAGAGAGGAEKAPQPAMQAAVQRLWWQWEALQSCRTAREVLDAVLQGCPEREQVTADVLASLADPEAGFSPVEDLARLPLEMTLSTLATLLEEQCTSQEAKQRLRALIQAGVARAASLADRAPLPSMAWHSMAEFALRCKLLPYSKKRASLDALLPAVSRLPLERLMQLAVFSAWYTARRISHPALLPSASGLLSSLIAQPVRLAKSGVVRLTADALLPLERLAASSPGFQQEQATSSGGLAPCSMSLGCLRPLPHLQRGPEECGPPEQLRESAAAALADIACGVPTQAGSGGHLLSAGSQADTEARWQHLVLRLQQLAFVRGGLGPVTAQAAVLRDAVRDLETQMVRCSTVATLRDLAQRTRALFKDALDVAAFQETLKGMEAQQLSASPRQLAKDLREFEHFMPSLLNNRITLAFQMHGLECALRIVRCRHELKLLAAQAEQAKQAGQDEGAEGDGASATAAEHLKRVEVRTQAVQQQLEVLQSFYQAGLQSNRATLKVMLEAEKHAGGKPSPEQAAANSRVLEDPRLGPFHKMVERLTAHRLVLVQQSNWERVPLDQLSDTLFEATGALRHLQPNMRAVVSLETIVEAAAVAGERLMGRLLLEHCTRPTLEPVFELMVRHLAAPRWERAMQQESAAAEEAARAAALAAAEAAAQALLEAEEEAGQAQQKSGKKKGKKGRAAKQQQQQTAGQAATQQAASGLPPDQQTDKEEEEEAQEGAPTPQQQSERRQEEEQQQQQQREGLEEGGGQEEGQGEGLSTPAPSPRPARAPSAEPSPPAAPDAAQQVKQEEHPRQAQAQHEVEEEAEGQPQPEGETPGQHKPQQQAAQQPQEQPQAAAGKKAGKRGRKKAAEAAPAAAVSTPAGPAEQPQRPPAASKPQAARPAAEPADAQAAGWEGEALEWDELQEARRQGLLEEEDWQDSRGRRGGEHARRQQPSPSPRAASKPAAAPAAQQQAPSSVQQPAGQRGPLVVGWNGAWVCACGERNLPWLDCKKCGAQHPCREYAFEGGCSRGGSPKCLFPHPPFALPPGPPPAANWEGRMADGQVRIRPPPGALPFELPSPLAAAGVGEAAAAAGSAAGPGPGQQPASAGAASQPAPAAARLPVWADLSQAESPTRAGVSAALAAAAALEAAAAASPRANPSLAAAVSGAASRSVQAVSRASLFRAGGEEESEEDLADMLGMLGLPPGSTAGTTGGGLSSSFLSAGAVPRRGFPGAAARSFPAPSAASSLWAAAPAGSPTAAATAAAAGPAVTPQHGFPGAPAGSSAAGASPVSLWDAPGSLPGLLQSLLPRVAAPPLAAGPTPHSQVPASSLQPPPLASPLSSPASASSRPPPAPASWAARTRAAAGTEADAGLDGGLDGLADFGLLGWPGLEGGEDEEEREFQAAVRASIEEARRAKALRGSRGGEPAENADGLALPGLRNEAGEYNCFLNVIIQCLSRCTEFRQQVAAWDARFCAAHPVLAALHGLFAQLQQQEQQQGGQAAGAGGQGAAAQPLDPTALREALAELPGQHFRMGEMNDAAEVLLSIYDRVTETAAQLQRPSGIDATFGLSVKEQVDCPSCHKSTQHNSYTQYFYNTHATLLHVLRSSSPGLSMGGLLREAEAQHQKSCDTDVGGCGRSTAVNHFLERAPRVFELQLTWASNRAETEEIAGVMAAVDEEVDLGEVYQGVERGLHRYRLRSMVCYYGQHYQALVLVPDAGGWLKFDDTHVTRVGAWADVKRKCEAGRVQPSVLFFEAVAGGGGGQ